MSCGSFLKCLDIWCLGDGGLYLHCECLKTKDMIHVNSADKKPERLNSFCVTVAH